MSYMSPQTLSDLTRFASALNGQNNGCFGFFYYVVAGMHTPIAIMY
jgi:hypothetical protein